MQLEATMLRRPKAADTEEDLLSFQESFLAAGDSPAARIGDKRPQAPLEQEQALHRDIVQLQNEGLPTLMEEEADRPPVKRSKFKERRERARKLQDSKGFDDPYEAMDKHDSHITKILSDIKEHDTLSSQQPFSMSVRRRTKHGFPTVNKLAASTRDESLANKPKRSLFAEQFETHPPEYFGIEVEVAASDTSSVTTGSNQTRDVVDPIVLERKQSDAEIAEVKVASEIGRGDHNVAPASAMEVDRRAGVLQTEPEIPTAQECMDSENSSGTIPDKESLEKRFHQPSLISGEGLISVGVAEGVAREKVAQIHQENVERLAVCSEDEILREKERILQLLGPNMVSFLKSKQQIRGSKDHSKDGKLSSEMVVGPELQEREASEEVERDEEGLHVSAPKGWVHMDEVEKEKMEWLTDVSSHQFSSQVAKDVRFSLDGLVVPRDLSLPSHLGLHHHGDEPQAAGYTLSELLPLCRSAVLQQRSLALQTLAKILLRARRNEYSEVVEGSVMDILLDSGLPLLLRYAVDENSESIFSAAVQCLHTLLVLPVEEYLLDEYCYCYHSYLPALRSPDQSRDSTEQEEKEADSEVIKSDLIKGYVDMKLQHRLRYILEVCQPPRETVLSILEILVRICRHSLQAASEVLNCPRLIKVVIEEFLPLAWSQEQDVTLVHGRPQEAAMKLVQVLCSAGRNIAAQLVSQYKLVAVLTRYTVLHPSELDLPLKEAYKLATISLRTWTTLLHYGFGDEAFRDTFPDVFLRQLQQLSSSTSLLSSLPPEEAGRVAALLQAIQAAVGVASITSDMLKLDGEKDKSLPSPAFSWSHVTGMLAPLQHCLAAWVEDCDSLQPLSGKVMCVANLLHCLASYYDGLPSKISQNPVEMLEQVEGLASGVVLKLVDSSLFTTALQILKITSALSGAHSSSSLLPSPASLPSHLTLPSPPKPALYGCRVMECADFQQLVQPHFACFSSANLISGYLRLILALSKLHKGVTTKVTTILQRKDFLEYFEGFVETPLPKLCSSFQFAELTLLYSALKLFVLQLVAEPDSISEPLLHLFHHAGFKLFTLLPPGWEYLAVDLLSSVILHPTLLCVRDGSMTSLIDKDITSLSLREPPHPSTIPTPSPSSHHPPSTSALLTKTLASLPSITETYRHCLDRAQLCKKATVNKSKCLLLHHPPQVSSQLLPPHTTSIVPVDWALLPIVLDYNNTLKSDAKLAVPSSNVVTMVTHSLQLLLLLEHLRPRVLREVPMSAKLARLMCTFLIDSDLFLVGDIHSYLSVLLRLYCTQEAQSSLNFDLAIPGLTSFNDLYSALLGQFAAVSYSDTLFACYTVLPLQQRFSVELRRLVWGEHSAVIRLLSLPLDQLPVDVKCFLEPVERDPMLLEIYLRHLATGTVRSLWSPLFYIIAIHHVHSFVFLAGPTSKGGQPTSAEVSSLQRSMMEGVLAMRDRETKRHVLLYGAADPDSALGFTLRAEMSDSQKTRMETLLRRTVDFSSLFS